MIGTTKKPVNAVNIIVRAAEENSSRDSAIKSSIAAAEKEVKVIMALYLLVLLMKMEPTTAPPTPKTIRPTAAKDISTSLNPKGLIRKLALLPKIRKVP